MAPYPDWFYFPSHARPPAWVNEFLTVVADARREIESRQVQDLSSDKVLAHLRTGLKALGYEVESGKARTGRIRRPVLFGDRGGERVAYEVDAVHDDLGILVEVEAGRGQEGMPFTETSSAHPSLLVPDSSFSGSCRNTDI